MLKVDTIKEMDLRVFTRRELSGLSGIEGDWRRRKDKNGNKRRRNIATVQSGAEGRPGSLQRYAQESKRLRYGTHQRDRIGQTRLAGGTTLSVQDHPGVLYSSMETTKGSLIFVLAVFLLQY